MKPISIFALLWLLSVSVAPVCAQSLYEYYADAQTAELSRETEDMGQQLRHDFNQKNILLNQQRIDFAAYFTNLKKAVVYSGKLAGYGRYQEDLDFARDNEFFRELPASPDSEVDLEGRREYVSQKYEVTRISVEEEIEIYRDLLNLSLDVCESMAGNDLSGFTAEESFRGEIDAWLTGEGFAVYRQQSAALSEAWPEISRRIERQLELWADPGHRPEAPIISSALVKEF